MRARIVYGNPRRFFVNGREVDEAEYHRRVPSKSLKGPGGRIVAPGMHRDYGDWSNEKAVLKRNYKDPGTVRDGRYCPQAARFAGDPKAVFRHREELVKWAEDRGKIVERD